MQEEKQSPERSPEKKSEIKHIKTNKNPKNFLS